MKDKMDRTSVRGLGKTKQGAGSKGKGRTVSKGTVPLDKPHGHSDAYGVFTTPREAGK